MKYINPLTAPSTTVATVDETARGRWDCLLQQFVLTPTGTQSLTPQDAQTAWEKTLAYTIQKLSQKPGVHMVDKHGNPTIQPPRRILCPTCDSENIEVPLIVHAGTNGFMESTKNGKGETCCPDCGYKGKQAKVKSYTMYSYADLVRDRFTLYNAMLEKQETLNVELA